jgi:hypothetical protein
VAEAALTTVFMDMSARGVGRPVVSTEPVATVDGQVTVKERIRESAVSVVESDFAHDRETIAALRRRTRSPKPVTRKLRRRKPGT